MYKLASLVHLHRTRNDGARRHTSGLHCAARRSQRCSKHSELRRSGAPPTSQNPIAKSQVLHLIRIDEYKAFLNSPSERGRAPPEQRSMLPVPRLPFRFLGDQYAVLCRRLVRPAPKASAGSRTRDRNPATLPRLVPVWHYNCPGNSARDANREDSGQTRQPLQKFYRFFPLGRASVLAAYLFRNENYRQ